MAFASMAIDSNGKMWDARQEGLPDELVSVIQFLKGHKPKKDRPAQEEAYLEVLKDLVRKARMGKNKAKYREAFMKKALEMGFLPKKREELLQSLETSLPSSPEEKKKE